MSSTLQQKAPRQSNLELLRIISMFLIVCSHYAVHSGLSFNLGLSGNRLLAQLLGTGGKFGVNCFVLISGYFLCQSEKFRWKSIVSFVVQTSVYSFVGYMIFARGGYTAKGVLASLVPLATGEWLFASTFFIYMLLTPVLSIIVKRLESKTYLAILILLTLLWCVIPTFSGKFMQANDLLVFVYLFLIAGYLRRGEIKALNGVIFPLIGLAVMIVFHVVLYVVLDVTDYSGGSALSGSTSIPIMLSSIFAFCLFKNVKPFYNKAVNFFASLVFGVYLLHDGNTVRYHLWIEGVRAVQFQDSNLFFVHALLSILLVFACGIVMSLLYKLAIDKPLGLLLCKLDPHVTKAYSKCIDGLYSLLQGGKRKSKNADSSDDTLDDALDDALDDVPDDTPDEDTLDEVSNADDSVEKDVK